MAEISRCNASRVQQVKPDHRRGKQYLHPPVVTFGFWRPPRSGAAWNHPFTSWLQHRATENLKRGGLKTITRHISDHSQRSDREELRKMLEEHKKKGSESEEKHVKGAAEDLHKKDKEDAPCLWVLPEPTGVRR